MRSTHTPSGQLAPYNPHPSPAGVHPMISPTIRSLISVANELGRCIDNIAAIKALDTYTKPTLAVLTSQWNEYHHFATYLAEQSNLDDYIIYPNYFRTEPPT